MGNLKGSSPFDCTSAIKGTAKAVPFIALGQSLRERTRARSSTRAGHFAWLIRRMIACSKACARVRRRQSRRFRPHSLCARTPLLKNLHIIGALSLWRMSLRPITRFPHRFCDALYCAGAVLTEEDPRAVAPARVFRMAYPSRDCVLESLRAGPAAAQPTLSPTLVLCKDASIKGSAHYRALSLWRMSLRLHQREKAPHSKGVRAFFLCPRRACTSALLYRTGGVTFAKM